MANDDESHDPAGPADPSAEATDIDRRAAVRRVVTAVGLTAGALAIPSLVGSASADPGESLRAGGGTDAGDAQTSLRADSTIAALKVENSNVRSGPAENKVDIVAPQLRLSSPVPSATRPPVPDLASMKPGDISAAGGLLYYGADVGSPNAVPAQIHTATFANYFQPIPALGSIVLATKSMTRAQRKAFPVGTFDSAGRVRKDLRVGLDLRPWIDSSHLPSSAAVSVSITAVGATESGTVRAFTDQTTPGWFTVTSFTVLPGGLLAGGKPYAIPATSGAVLALDADDRLWLAVSASAHLNVQILGLIIPDASAMVEPQSSPASLTAAQRRAALQRQAVREMIQTVVPPR